MATFEENIKNIIQKTTRNRILQTRSENAGGDSRQPDPIIDDLCVIEAHARNTPPPWWLGWATGWWLGWAAGLG